MPNSHFRHPYREPEPEPAQTGGPGSSVGEEPEIPAQRMYAFTDRPVRIIWIDERGNRLYVQLVDYVPPDKKEA